MLGVLLYWGGSGAEFWLGRQRCGVQLLARASGASRSLPREVIGGIRAQARYAKLRFPRQLLGPGNDCTLLLDGTDRAVSNVA